MGIVIALLLLALLFGGFGLFAGGSLQWLLIIALVLLIASAFGGWRSYGGARRHH